MKRKARLKIEWTPEMIQRLRYEFPYAYNRVLSKELGVSPRSLIRKARELGIEKEDKFLEKRQNEIQRMARAYRSENPTKGMKGWCVPNSEATRFKPGNISPMVSNPEVREKVKQSRLQLIEDEKYRIRNGLDRQTKLKLKI